MAGPQPNKRVKLRRLHERGAFDRVTIDAILDATPICHVGYLRDGAPAVTPTIHWREGDQVYWHGSSASHMLRQALEGEVCLTVTHLDGFVLARSGFHHSMNYRSVMIFGKPEIVVDADEKTARLKAFMDGLFPGRWDEVRAPTAQELKATTILSMAIDLASAKVRTGGPVDDADDYALPVWAGTVPVTMTIGEPQSDPAAERTIDVPDYLRNMSIG